MRNRVSGQRVIGISLIVFSLLLIILLSLVKANLDDQSAFLCSMVHENPDVDMKDCPAHKSNTSWLLIASFSLSFLVLGGGVYVMLMPLWARKDYPKADISKLDEEEKQVYALLEGHEGSLYQSDILKEMGFSKVKVSRILDKMEHKGILERKRRGMTNIIVLK